MTGALVLICICFAWSAGYWLGRAREPEVREPPVFPPSPPRPTPIVSEPQKRQPLILMIDGTPHLPYNTETVEVYHNGMIETFMLEQYRVGTLLQRSNDSNKCNCAFPQAFDDAGCIRCGGSVT